jgi:hypothetical protein
MRNPNRLQVVSLLVAAAIGVTARAGKWNNSNSPSDNVPAEYVPLRPGAIESPLGALTPEDSGPKVKIPSSIFKNHTTRPELPMHEMPSDGVDGQGHLLYFEPQKIGDFLNIDLGAVRRQEIEQTNDLKARGIANGPVEISSVPVYTATELNLWYIAGEPEIFGSETLDLPDGQDAEASEFFGFFDGKRYQLDVTVTSPDPLNEPEYKDNIHLQIPGGIDIPPPVR